MTCNLCSPGCECGAETQVMDAARLESLVLLSRARALLATPPRLYFLLDADPDALLANYHASTVTQPAHALEAA